ncbi:MAG: aminotransferase class V-fold PLP-dependent enzyme, partial [Solirubrobacterales bacterium]|nr:aminotransferase class V-fold PLP-dependent enzyme [Solirubrobacterales bacterium]
MSATETLSAVASEFPVLRRQFDGRPLTYLDSAATSQTPQPVIDALTRYYTHSRASIHRGVYPLAVEATELYEGARERIAAWLGSTPEETIFAANATAAINLVAYAWGRQNVGRGDLVVLTEMEHHSNIVPWQILCQDREAELAYVPVLGDGQLDLDALEQLLAREPKLVALVHVSNVLGTINPVAQVVQRAHAVGAIVLVDGTQAVPQLPVDLRALDADFYAWTGHKAYGPTGIGVLHGRRELLEQMPPFIGGGHMIRTVAANESTWTDL